MKKLDDLAKKAYHAEIDRQTAEGREFLDWMKCWQASVDVVKAELEKRRWIMRFAWTAVLVAIVVAWKMWQP
jgi:truncated hemoglobin YjbI